MAKKMKIREMLVLEKFAAQGVLNAVCVNNMCQEACWPEDTESKKRAIYRWIERLLDAGLIQQSMPDYHHDKWFKLSAQGAQMLRNENEERYWWAKESKKLETPLAHYANKLLYSVWVGRMIAGGFSVAGGPMLRYNPMFKNYSSREIDGLAFKKMENGKYIAILGVVHHDFWQSSFENLERKLNGNADYLVIICSCASESRMRKESEKRDLLRERAEVFGAAF